MNTRRLCAAKVKTRSQWEKKHRTEVEREQLSVLSAVSVPYVYYTVARQSGIKIYMSPTTTRKMAKTGRLFAQGRWVARANGQKKKEWGTGNELASRIVTLRALKFRGPNLIQICSDDVIGAFYKRHFLLELEFENWQVGLSPCED